MARKRPRLVRSLIALALVVLTDAARILVDPFLLENNETSLDVLVGYHGNLSTKLVFGGTAFRRVKAVHTSLTVSQIEELRNDPDVSYVEINEQVQMLGEITPFGWWHIEPLPVQTLEPANCSDPNSLKVAIIDSGVDSSHIDLSCALYNNCIGKTFGSNEAWNAPDDSHGTAVMGIVGAVANNNIGIHGVIDGRGICWVVARVFSSQQPGATLADVFAAIEFAAEKGATIVNLSLGATGYSRTGDILISDLYNNFGMLFVAASGNNGDTTLTYPASYSPVISVGSVDSLDERASFSNYNAGVDLVAPGTQVLSLSANSMGQELFVNCGSIAALGRRAVSSGYATGSVGGVLVDCGKATSICPGSRHVCFFERRSGSLAQQVQNCEASGGRAAIVYDPTEVLTEFDVQSLIPVVGISVFDGQRLSTLLGNSVAFGYETGYATVDGTSFSVPYVSGVVASVWNKCPSCTNFQVSRCLTQTAVDLGASGRDDEYGFGLVRAVATFECLRGQGCCQRSTLAPTVPAGPSSTPMATPTPQPTPSPTAPTLMPTSSPTSVCTAEKKSYLYCFNQSLASEEKSQCAACLNQQLPVPIYAINCTILHDILCPAIGECGCSACADELIRFVDCQAQTTRDDACRFNCTGEPTAGPTVQPSVAPTSLPTDVAFLNPNCSSFESLVESCLKSESMIVDVVACQKCINDTIPPWDTPCSNETKATVCAAIQSCDCGSCLDVIQVRLSCVYSCDLGCQFLSSTTPRPVSSPTSKPTPVPTMQTVASLAPTPMPLPIMVPTLTQTSKPDSSPSILGQTSNPATGTLQPTSTSSNLRPTTSSLCQQELNSYNDCVASQPFDLVSGCNECVSSVVLQIQQPGPEPSDTSSDNCSRIQRLVCTANDTCYCGSCSQQMEVYLSCQAQSNSSCPVDCPPWSVAPSISPTPRTVDSGGTSLTFCFHYCNLVVVASALMATFILQS